MTVATDYFDAVVRRSRVPMEPFGFEPDWQDQPRRHNVYPGVRHLPLATGAPALASTEVALRPPAAADAGEAGGLTLPLLGQLLHASYAITGWRLSLNPNEHTERRTAYPLAIWSRGVASGGGLYPLEIYWASGARGPVLPGVYNYSGSQHAMQRLLVGDVTDAVRAALPPGEGDDTDQFLLLTIKHWKNAFKYNSFSYHATTMDVGTALGTWQMWTRAAGLTLRPLLDVDAEPLDRLLGVHTPDESVHAVVPLPWAAPSGARQPRPAAGVAAAEPAITAVPFERSATVLRFPVLEQVHASAVTSATDRPTPAQMFAGLTVAPPRDGGVELPEPARLDLDLGAALRQRRSSFGRFSAQRPVRLDQVSALLSAAADGSRLVSDVKHDDGTPALTRLVLFANHVAGLPPGAYDHQPDGRLTVAVDGEVAQFLQANYFLKNYNLEQAGLVLAIVSRAPALFRAVGHRAYRYVNAEVGAAAMAVYTACSALGLGCGAALGFDNVSYAEHLGLAPDAAAAPEEWPLLIVMVGNERDGGADFDARLT